jgi:F-type H+-transporting ATPase subunit a
MASPVLHIKDAYYFEVPKVLWTSNRESKADFPDVWVKLDADFQLWEAERLHGALAGTEDGDVPAWPELRDEYLHWKEDHAHFGKPLDVMLEEHFAQVHAAYRETVKAAEAQGESGPTFQGYLEETHPPLAWFSRRMIDEDFQREWETVKQQAGDVAVYKALPAPWAPSKVTAYNEHLSGKVLIPQPFGELRNLYEPESGFCISKFLIVQVFVALLLVAVFSWLARRMASGGPPRGRLWNLLEIFLVFVRDSIARPAIGAREGDRYVPLLWTLFMFVLLCNLCGLVPWVGTPTASFSVTTGLAFVTFATGVCFGMMKFGVLGFFANQIPSMDLAWPLAILIKPMLLAIELLGFCIKHMVLAIRLLANMVAGHLVLLGIMGLAFGAVAAMKFAGAPNWQWWLTAAISVLASTLFSCLELFVAFLQAYIFTFLSALFIGAAVHHH